MRAYDRKVLLYATAILLAGISSGADARYWRHYGYHWYGRTWNGSRTNSDERQVRNNPLAQNREVSSATREGISARLLNK